jgi:hypothetical protein
MTPQPDPTEEDPLVRMYVEKALAPIVGKMPPHAVGIVRARLYHFYETNPEAVALLNDIREAQKAAPVVERSGDQVRRDDAALEEAARRAAGGGKGSGR